MRFFVRLILGSLFIFSFLVGCSQARASALPEGYIRFAVEANGGGKGCSIPFKTGRWNLIDGAYGCSEDDYNYFMLDNVRSAATFRFSSDYATGAEGPNKCDWDGGGGNDWAFEVGTYKNPTTTIWIPISSLRGYYQGDIIKAGIRMIANRNESGDIDEELECVSIELSPLP